jgi:general secretion pathway protein K
VPFGNCQLLFRGIDVMPVTRSHQQSGAAIVAAMLTVALVASFAATALWQQSRSIEAEAADRARVQSAWPSAAALDWARLVLREDARAGTADHLSEPWAERFDGAQLSKFLSVDKNNVNNELDASLTGQIIDLQSRLNVMNLIDKKALSSPDLNSFTRLFELLGLPAAELSTLANELLKATADNEGVNAPNASLPPQRVEHLVWLGLSAPSLATLRPFITLLPVRTPINLNTASVEVIYASMTVMPLGDARKLVELRNASYFRSLADAAGKVGVAPDPFNQGRHGVASSYFEVRTSLKQNQTWVEERAVLQREETSVRVILREGTTTAAAQPAAPAKPPAPKAALTPVAR